MLRSSFLIVISLVVLACSKEKAKDAPASPPPPPVVADAAAVGSAGSADMGSAGSADMGSAGSADMGSAAGSGSAAAGSGSAEGSGSGTFVFDKLTREEKVKFMKQKVMPAMKAAFQKFDPEEFASFTCKTCHGKDPVKAKHKMPSPELPKLDFAAIKAGKEDPKWIEFMSKVVQPQMAKLLNEPEMTKTQEGFGCLDCHTEKK